jgi:glycosyltransferase involved in cell wall biosynthesis
MTLLTSEREGFGLPVLEALACGTPVVASDIGVLREVGGDAADYAPVGDAARFTQVALRLLAQRSEGSEAWEERRKGRIARARAFSWEDTVRDLCGVYRQVLLETRR